MGNTLTITKQPRTRHAVKEAGEMKTVKEIKAGEMFVLSNPECGTTTFLMCDKRQSKCIKTDSASMEVGALYKLRPRAFVTPLNQTLAT